MTETSSNKTFTFHQGQIIYKREGFNVLDFEILSVNKNTLQIKNLKNKTVITHAVSYVSIHFKLSRIMLLRDLLIDLDERMEEVIKELGEYDYKVLMGEIWPKELD